MNTQKPVMSKKQICTFFGCTMDQLNQQYKRNADTLAKMRDKAVLTGKKVNKYTAAELTEATKRYQGLSVS